MWTQGLYELNKSGGTSQWKQTDGTIKLKQFGGGYDVGGQVWSSEALKDNGVRAWAIASAMLFGKKSELVRIDARAAVTRTAGDVTHPRPTASPRIRTLPRSPGTAS